MDRNGFSGPMYLKGERVIDHDGNIGKVKDWRIIDCASIPSYERVTVEYEPGTAKTADGRTLWSIEASAHQFTPVVSS